MRCDIQLDIMQMIIIGHNILNRMGKFRGPLRNMDYRNSASQLLSLVSIDKVRQRTRKLRTDVQGVPKTVPLFYFCDNFRKWTPILTIFSPLEPEIYDT